MAGKLRYCNLCNKNEGRYCCSYCRCYYCSLECYKSEIHSKCSELFYRRHVEEQLALNAELEVLLNKKNECRKYDQQFVNENTSVDNDLDSDDEIGIEPLDFRLANINLNDSAKVWSVLTTDEKNEFEAIVSSDWVQTLVDGWEPWWLYHKKVEELEGETDVKEEEALKRCPPIIQVPKLENLTSIEPAPCVQFDILNVMCAYAFVMRYFNGDVEAVEATNCILNICESLDSNSNFSTATMATKAVERRCEMSKLMEANRSTLDRMGFDSFRLVQGPSASRNRYFCLAALSHMHQLFTESIKVSKSPKKNITKSPKKEETPTESSQNDKNSVSSEENKESECLQGKESMAESSQDQTAETENAEGEKESDFFKRFPQSKPTLEVEVKKVKRCVKKIEYYIAYFNKLDEDRLKFK